MSLADTSKVASTPDQSQFLVSHYFHGGPREGSKEIKAVRA